MYQPSTPYHLDLQKKEELAKQKLVGASGSPAIASSAGAVGGSPGGLGSPTPYKCHICGFAATRLNVIIACQKKCSEAMKNKQQQPKGKSTPRSSLGSPLASPSRKQVVSKAKGGSSPAASRPAKKAATESTPKKTASPKKSTGATAAAAPPAAASKRKSSLNGNDKNATVASADTAAKAKGASGPTPQSPAPVAKKQRMTKKQKIEQEKKKEARKNILDEWGDEEEDESDEKKRINETLGRSSDGGEGSDDGDSVHGEGVFG